MTSLLGSADTSSSGVATHIGAFWLSARETENFLTGTISDGAFTWTTTRGDTISGTYGGSFAPISPTSVKFRSPGWITGGTGRYRGATGTVVFAGVANSATFRVLGAFTPTLSPGD